MPRSPSAEVAALRTEAEGICAQVLGQVREQARLIRTGAVGQLTEATLSTWPPTSPPPRTCSSGQLRRAARARLTRSCELPAEKVVSRSRTHEAVACPLIRLAIQLASSQHEWDRYGRPGRAFPKTLGQLA